jgi:hypothetical protein
MGMAGALTLPKGLQKSKNDKPKSDSRGSGAFDEADTLFGTGMKMGTSGRTPAKQLRAPTDLAISKINRKKLLLTWQDNSTREYGVSLYRKQINTNRDRQNFNKMSWKFIGNFEERFDAKVKGKGKRGDQDTGLLPGTNYCYRVQAYFGFDKSETSGFSNTVCARTKNARRIN